MMSDQTHEHEPLSDGKPSTWGTRLRRHPAQPPRGAVVASVLVHVGAVAGMWAAGIALRPNVPEFVQYRVTLVSPPAQVQAPQPQPVQTTTPVVADPEPPPPERPQAERPPERPQTQAPTPRPDPEPRPPEPARGPDPKPVTVGGENININIEGAEFPYPDYLAHITQTLVNYFRWNGPPNLEAEVVFHIQRDGSAGGIRVARRSGDFNFNLQAVEAVEQAGRARAFGPLPDDWQGDRLWISFTFYPRR
jgi:outer membrane biosynthesis protein TonB